MRQAVFAFTPFLAIALVFGAQAWSLAGERERLEGEVLAAQGEVQALETKVARTGPLREELAALEENVAQYIRILPSPEVATAERLLELVEVKRGRAGMGVESIDLQRRTTRTRREEHGFVEVGIAWSAQASFEQLVKFLNELERHESFMRVNAFSAAATASAEEDAPPLAVTIDLSTFRYEAGR